MSIWTPARTDDLLELSERGLSTMKIALHLGNGITRNAIIGKLHRLAKKTVITGKLGAVTLDWSVDTGQRAC